MFERSRIVIHGNPLRWRPGRTNAQRRSPAKPAQEASTSDSGSAAIDLTGYRHSAATRPTAVIARACRRVGRRRS